MLALCFTFFSLSLFIQLLKIPLLVASPMFLCKLKRERKRGREEEGGGGSCSGNNERKEVYCCVVFAAEREESLVFLIALM